MNETVFLTIFAGVVTFVIGELIVKLVIDPVQNMKSTIGVISHTLVQYANVIANPGTPKQELMDEASTALRGLSSRLRSHLCLVPKYNLTARLFGLPSHQQVCSASRALIGLSNSVYRATDRVFEMNAKSVEHVCDSLGIPMEEGDRWPEDSRSTDHDRNPHR